MAAIFYPIIILMIFIEMSIYVDFPYFALGLTFIGYLTYKEGKRAIIYSMIIAFFTDFSSYGIIFFMFYTFLLYQIYKHINFTRINIVIVSILEILLYFLYLGIFKMNTFDILIIIKEFIFVFIYNSLFFELEKLDAFKKK
ncbi:hypothetical protein [Haliovirga abyssi]|uniref:Rod shape-determining protein MreD n=1 Tax=Haliovirga abyssi TaxID=2996794 RepID=A0AAU9DC78_9FUSO|nr:hypothetical protein [Haliovirga abyssi]BDU49892.1 hypothetical protein HLVA_04610 [Haliovirga abyssi]